MLFLEVQGEFSMQGELDIPQKQKQNQNHWLLLQKLKKALNNKMFWSEQALHVVAKSNVKKVYFVKMENALKVGQQLF